MPPIGWVAKITCTWSSHFKKVYQRPNHNNVTYCVQPNSFNLFSASYTYSLGHTPEFVGHMVYKIFIYQQARNELNRYFYNNNFCKL